MTIELALYCGLVLHLIGDYVTQNDWMAQNKTKSTAPALALIHALVYSLPFVLLTGNNWQFAVIISTHFFIDRYRLAVYWIKLVNWNWDSKNFGYADNTPAWMAMWLMIIVDNVFHIVINSLCIYYSFEK